MQEYFREVSMGNPGSINTTTLLSGFAQENVR